ncbi:MAG TPA: hypothetical protein VIC57_17815, partial [Candidatus Dormibacteraeota bacterium]
MSTPQINRSWKAAPGYRDTFSLADRLRDLTSYGVVSGRLSEEEANLIEGATDAAGEFLTWQWRERWVDALLSGIEAPGQQAEATEHSAETGGEE